MFAAFTAKLEKRKNKIVDIRRVKRKKKEVYCSSDINLDVKVGSKLLLKILLFWMLNSQGHASQISI